LYHCRRNDRISFYDQDIGCWSSITITSNPSRKKGWKHFYHYINDEGETGGIYLRPDERWTFLDDENIEPIETDIAPANIGQIDGDVVPASLTPTPETSPDQEVAKVTGARPKQGLRFGPSEFFQDSSDSDSPDAAHHRTRESPEWDPYGTDLHSPGDLLDLAINHGCVPPFRLSPISTEDIPLDRVANFDNVLPITSTPNPSPPRKKRVSNLRRSLPLESPGNNRPVFLGKLNPFKKKSSKH
jgi:hypothetical protein